MSTTRTIHCNIDVRGVLRWPKKKLVSMFKGTKQGDKVLRTADEIIDALMDQLSLGREVLPIGPPCEGWSYKTGCPGHAEDGGEA